MQLTIEYIDKSTFEGETITQFGGWKVTQGDKTADGLCWEEMLGLVAANTLLFVERVPCIHWLRTPGEHEAERVAVKNICRDFNNKPFES